MAVEIWVQKVGMEEGVLWMVFFVNTSQEDRVKVELLQ